MATLFPGARTQLLSTYVMSIVGEEDDSYIMAKQTRRWTQNMDNRKQH